jgi:hypothetical protein
METGAVHDKKISLINDTNSQLSSVGGRHSFTFKRE